MRAHDQCPAESFRPVTEGVVGVLADRMPQDKRAGTYSVLKLREALLPFFTLPRHCRTRRDGAARADRIIYTVWDMQSEGHTG